MSGDGSARYERVRIAAARDMNGQHRKARTVLLRVTSDGPQFLCGYRVDKDGSRAGTLTIAAIVEVIDKTLIRRRTPLAMSRLYGTLIVSERGQEDGEPAT